MRRFALLLLLPFVLFIAACGSNSSSSTSTGQTGQVKTIPGPSEARPVPMSRPSTAQLVQHCPPGSAAMGCAQQAIPQQRRGPAFALPSGPRFPDVYEGQGAVNWAAVKGWQRSHGWPAAAIFKMGEFRLDHQAVRNASLTRALGFWRAGYVFVRNIGCGTEIGNTELWARELGLRIVVLDAEVPEARGYATCMAPALGHAGLIVIEYSSPGSNPDSRNPRIRYLWPAAYGPSHPPCLFTCSVGALSSSQTIVAWQETDGQFGTVYDIPGLGRGDVSIAFGITKIGATPATKPKPLPPHNPYRVAFNQCFHRGFNVRWDRQHHRKVPPSTIVFSRPGCQAGYNAGYKAG